MPKIFGLAPYGRTTAASGHGPVGAVVPVPCRRPREFTEKTDSKPETVQFAPFDIAKSRDPDGFKAGGPDQFPETEYAEPGAMVPVLTSMGRVLIVFPLSEKTNPPEG